MCFNLSVNPPALNLVEYGINFVGLSEKKLSFEIFNAYCYLVV